MNTTASLKPMLLTAAAAVLCTGLQFTGIDALATPRSAEATATVLKLPLVVVTAKREATLAMTVQQLPQVVIVARRLDAPGTAQALNATVGSAT